jgi:hypothetical protein
MGTIVKPAVRDAWGDDAMSSADMVDPGNSAVSTGWPLSTTPPSRQRFNWLLNYCMNAVRYFCRRGIADYDAAETYVANDVTRGPDNILYSSLVAGNIGNTPATSPTKWAPLPYVTAATLATAIAPLATSSTVTSDVTALNASIASAKAAAIATAETYANGTQNLRPNGWKMDPDGFMQIWGEMTIKASGGTAINFATECGAAFASACCGVQLTTCTASDSGSIGGIALGVPFVYAVSKAGFSADNLSGATINTYWHAIGF